MLSPLLNIIIIVLVVLVVVRLVFLGTWVQTLKVKQKKRKRDVFA